jgi:hypothetical protein
MVVLTTVLLRRCTDNSTKPGLALINRGVLVSNLWSQTTEKNEECKDYKSKDKYLALSWVHNTVFAPSPAALGKGVLEGVGSKLVVQHAHKRNSVSENLGSGDWVTIEEDGCEHKEDVLQHTAKSKDEGRCLANL